MTVIIEPN